MAEIDILKDGLYDMGKKKKAAIGFRENHPVIYDVCLVLLPLILTAIGVEIFGIYDDIKSIDDIKNNLESIKEDVRTLQEENSNLGGEIDNLYSLLVLSSIKPTELLEEIISKDYNKKDQLSGQDTGLMATSVVAYNEMTGEQYTVNQLADFKLLLPYTDSGQEIVFYGSFNESGQWDGNCTLNVYEDNKLVLITDAEYKDGSLLSSKQVFSYELQSGEPVWALSDRMYENGIGIGDTYLYAWEHGYTKDFTLDDVTVKDVLHAEKFISSLEPRLAAYYSGDISDGYFNDDSGNAYMVYFFEDGTVRLLYSGRFKDGTFHDNTGEAWYIVKEEDTDYMYYKGNFENGAEDHSSITELGHPPLTLEEIEAYIGDCEYGVELRWAGFESVPSVVNMI